jgi:integral membrane protein (TIGR01906 family)
VDGGAVIRTVAAVVVALTVPVLLVTSAVRWTTLDTGFYLQEFAKYRIGFNMGLSDQQLHVIADDFAAYFQGPPGELHIVADLPSGRQALLNAKEIHHMVDVQVLMRLVFQLWVGSFIILGIAVAIMVLPHPSSAAPWVMTAAASGGILTVVLIAGIGAAAALDFNSLFYRFHMLSFTNDLWLLDPRTDRLIQLFPIGFFFDAAMRIALSAAIAGALVAASALAWLRFR